jgi:hypothetical protein
MDLTMPQCDALKKTYDDCYTKWRYQKPTVGEEMTSLHICNEVFEDYKSCYIVSFNHCLLCYTQLNVSSLL